MQIEIDLNERVLREAVSVQLIKGELGEMVAEKLAEFQSEIMTFNRTEVAQLMNKSRSTIYQLESEGKLKFRNNTISLKELREFRRKEQLEDSESDSGIKTTERISSASRPKRRVLK